MTKFRNLSIFLMVFALFSLNSCDSDDDANPYVAPPQPTSVNDVVNYNGSLSILENALKQANLSETLKGAGPFTVFAPSNGAFDALADETGFEDGPDLLAKIDAGLLTSILSYHVVPGSNSAGDLTEGTKLTTVEGGELTATVSADGTVQLLDARKQPTTNPVISVTRGNLNSGNGIVHIIDKILLPEAAITALSIDRRPTILDLATSTDDLSTLVEALTKAGLVKTVAGLKTGNVLAPTNEAFAGLLELLGPDYKSIKDFDNPAEIAVLGNILKYHVLTAETLAAGPAETALKDNSVEVISATGGFAFGDATDTDAGTLVGNIEAKNGFVSIIDKVLLPQAALDFDFLLGSPDLATTVIDSPLLTILEEALIKTELVETFTDATNAALDSTETNFTYFRPATVFAPTDDAFTDLFATLGDDYTNIDSFESEEDVALLKQILLYHVVPGNIAVSDLSAGNVTTAAEADIEVIEVLGSNEFVIGDATNNDNATLVAEVMARNGIAHVVDKVLLSPIAVAFVKSLEEDEDSEN